MTAHMDFDVVEQRHEHWPSVWRILEPTFRAGESYPLPQDVSEDAARDYWIKKDGYNGVAFKKTGAIIGVYYLRPDQGGPGDHICNAGYVVGEASRGRGLASRLCLQSKDQARKMGYRGMKFNLVVSVNEPAVKAWTGAGMKIIGTTPKAFRHPHAGFVDAYIMYSDL